MSVGILVQTVEQHGKIYHENMNLKACGVSLNEDAGLELRATHDGTKLNYRVARPSEVYVLFVLDS